MNILRGSVVGLSGLVGVGVLAWPSVTTAASADSDEVYKRDERITELALVADDDDDDTNDNTRSRTGTNTGQTNTNTGTRSGDQNDPTRSNQTGVSRDRDLSRADKTRDWTRDGAGDRKRDWSANKTNDRSRNDTRR